MARVAGLAKYLAPLIRRICRVIERSRMPGVGMAPLAQKGLFCDQHLVFVGAMGLVTGQTIFPNRLVFPQEWPTLVLVALITELVDVGRL